MNHLLRRVESEPCYGRKDEFGDSSLFLEYSYSLMLFQCAVGGAPRLLKLVIG